MANAAVLKTAVRKDLGVRIPRPPFRRVVVWLIPILLTLHNAEEAIAFRRLLPRMRAMMPAALESRLSYGALVQALVALSAVAFVLAIVAHMRPHSARWFWLLLALQAAIGINAVAHVITAAFLFRDYAPGVLTAVLVNAPFTGFVFARASRDQWVSAKALRATVPAALVLHGPILLGALWLATVLSR